MKTLLLLCAVVGLCTTTDLQAYDFSEGEVLTVSAPAGLRLRMAPDINARTISVLEAGATVVVTNTFGFSSDKRARVEWMDGHWIKVRAGELTGYVFDGFLTSLKPLNHEEQLCIDCENLVYSIDRYLFDNYQPVSMYDGPDNSEEITQYVTCLEDSICTIKTSGDGWFEFEASFHGKRISEIVGLMRSMLVGRGMLDAFNESLVFYEDRNGQVERIEIRLFSSPITIEYTDGTVYVKSMVLGVIDGC